MASFTLQLWQVIDSLYSHSTDEDRFDMEYDSFTFGSDTWGKLPKLPEYNTINLAYYPIFDEAYRPILNGLIIDEYYNQEICTETIDNWLLIIRKKMDQIMPYYNQLFASERLTFDPLITMDINSATSSTTEGTESGESTSNTETDSKSAARAVNSSFPQTALAGNADYATAASDTNSSSEVDASATQNNTGQSNTESSSDSHVTGYQGNVSNLIAAYRNILISINQMILADLSDCFMLLHNNGDEYFAPRYGVIY